MTPYPFLDWDFIPLALNQQTELEPFLLRYPQRLTGYTFGNLVAWSEVDHYAWTWLEPETLLIAYDDSRSEQKRLLQPIGQFSPAAQQKLLEALKRSPYPIKLMAVSDDFIGQFPQFCAHFNRHHDRGMDNYIYRTQDLATLTGRRYSKKRNLIAQASELYQWTIHPLTSTDRPKCCRILEDIGLPSPENLSQGLQEEHIVLHFLMTHYSQLKQKGLVIVVDNCPVAFSIYEEIAPGLAGIHFEKAQREFKGLYQLINRETAKVIAKAGYPLMNREEDLGVQGLRQTKLSYFPSEILRYNILSM